MLLLESNPAEPPRLLEHNHQPSLTHLQAVDLLWSETRKLTDFMSGWSESSVPPQFVPSKRIEIEHMEGKTLEEIGNDLLKEVGKWRIEFKAFRENYYRILKKISDKETEPTPGRFSYEMLNIWSQYADEIRCSSVLEELSPGIPNPLTGIAATQHGIDSVYRNDPLESVLPSRWSEANPPNCLGLSLYLTAGMETIDYRFLHCSTLQSHRTEERELQVLMLRNIVSFLKTCDAPPERIERIEARLKRMEGMSVMDWMYHHCLLCEYNREHSRWMFIDPYVGGTADLGVRPDLSLLKSALDIRKDDLPGLSVPIQINFGAKTRRKKLHRANARARTRFGPLYQKYREITRRRGGYLTVEEFRAELHGQPELKVFNWAERKYRAELKREKENALKVLTEEEVRKCEKFVYRTPESEEVIEIIGQIANYSWVNSSDNLVDQAYAGGHRTVEVHANHAHALGLLLKHASFAETNLRAFPSDILLESSSQLAWREVGGQIPSAENRIPVLAASKAASSFFGKELGEHLLHPLVLRECRRQSLR
jgi:hypothetical protein